MAGSGHNPEENTTARYQTNTDYTRVRCARGDQVDPGYAGYPVTLDFLYQPPRYRWLYAPADYALCKGIIVRQSIELGSHGNSVIFAARPAGITGGTPFH